VARVCEEKQKITKEWEQFKKVPGRRRLEKFERLGTGMW
jgi:hypothetical protein